MRININIEKRYAYLVIGILISILGFLVVNAHNSGHSPNVAGHDVLEIDWSKTIPTLKGAKLCLNGICKTNWESSATMYTPPSSNSGSSSAPVGTAAAYAYANTITSCIPTNDCASMGMNCGTFVDNCYIPHNCGTCPSGQTCNTGHCSGSSSGTGSSESTCTPKTCSELGKTCGTVSDGCGGTLNCGACASGSKCNNGKCCYTQSACSIYGFECGTWDNGCGTMINCGGCPTGQTCDKTQAKCVSSCVPKTCKDLNLECGSGYSDYCGGILDCGNPCYAEGKVCISGHCEFL